MNKVGGKKDVASKKKEKTSENKIKIVKKMKGGEEKNEEQLQLNDNFILIVLCDMY